MNGERIDPETGERLKPGELTGKQFRAWLARLPKPLTWDGYLAWAKTMARDRHQTRPR